MSVSDEVVERLVNYLRMKEVLREAVRQHCPHGEECMHWIEWHADARTILQEVSR